MSVTLAYADWCGHCKEIKPKWNNVKAKFQGVQIIELNADKDGDKIKALGIQGYPTIFSGTGKNRVEYNGDRSEKSLEDFFTKAGATRKQGGGAIRKQRGGALIEPNMYNNIAIVAAAISGYFFYLGRSL